MSARVQHTTTSGTFNLDGGSWEVENNVWLVGDDTECVVIDAPHQLSPILELIGDRQLRAILCTHAHDDHVTAARQLSEATGAPVRLHPADEVLWRQTHPDFDFVPLAGGEQLEVAGVSIEVRHTPGHSPGGVCFYVAELGVVFSGDTLFKDGPGATGRSYSNFGTLLDTIRSGLFTLPIDTVVHTGHGDSTSVGAEAPHLDEWIARGH
ncbi:MAG TPA: MBL fold metallo-hydrolase [Jatrophihabitans sp.]|jgi:glyoxylase-like metal-dependent hydrolase (beta-lactamase superfamily II)|uniref:MBL fold metallo-hydrolase n=1 Tax=Jatrophihabitans sp. TaxID=1932789 RepID=UPI002F1E98A6